MIPIDPDWRAANPLPVHGAGTDKNSRGRVLIAGGAEFVPGALRLTGEAALRSGAGKLRLATVESAAMALGVLVPEAAMIPLPQAGDGEIAKAAGRILAEAIERADTYVFGPGTSDQKRAHVLVAATMAAPRDDLSVVLDAAAIGCVGDLAEVIAAHGGRVVLTPHVGEMIALTGLDADAINADPACAAREAAERFNAVVVLKGGETVIAAPDGTLLHYAGGGVGLATGGSGDVLAGIIGGLLSRGAAPIVAAGWGVWLHGEAGRRAGEWYGPIGFLARDLLEHIPGLMIPDREG